MNKNKFFLVEIKSPSDICIRAIRIIIIIPLKVFLIC